MCKIYKVLILFLCFSAHILYGQETRPINWAKKLDINAFINLYKVNDSIYRSEQPDSFDILTLKQLGIKSMLNLRNKHHDSVFIGKSPLELYTVHMKAQHIKDKDVINALKIMEKAPKPILIHCKHGSDRTGLIVAMYRIAYQNWTKDQALDELKNGGYGFHKIFMNIPAYIKKVDVEKIRAKVLQ
ncbi:MAG TPA: dual specificity protein phosphatase family protein [Bacteroidales bacterium]|jgi:protein tyrosine/serine phosphatase|nr:dual specificity protein phosphatase family protein [Bacteroidales bacterium]HNV95199.1 dual specificity protein phosphatase family protein [Bacteroidales bacterium]HOU98128.1 dual specificity protein phosphatase family protein [Bacteroidales bacterium]